MKTLASATFTGFVQASHMDAGSILLAGLTIYMENAVAIRPNDLVVVDAHLDESGAWRGRLEKHLHNPVLEQAAAPMGGAARQVAEQRLAAPAETPVSAPAPAAAPARSEIGARATAQSAPSPAPTAAPTAVPAPISVQTSAPAAPAPSRAARFATSRAAATPGNRPPSAAPQPRPAVTPAAPAAARPVFNVHDGIDDDIPF